MGPGWCQVHGKWDWRHPRKEKAEILSFEAINVSLLTEEKPFSALLISGWSPAAIPHKSVHVSANGQITTEVVSIGLILKHHLCCQIHVH